VAKTKIVAPSKSGKKLISIDEAAQGLRWLEGIGASNLPAAHNARIVIGLIKGLERVLEMSHFLDK
jgi:hypothetical protein